MGNSDIISNMPEWDPNFLKLMRLRRDGNYDYIFDYRVSDNHFRPSTPGEQEHGSSSALSSFVATLLGILSNEYFMWK